jgi:predicted nucleic acid-binding protein
MAPLACVVDASVAIKLFVPEPLSERADALFAHLAADPPGQISVPELFYIECANILWKHTRRSNYPIQASRKALTDLGTLALNRFTMAALMAPAFNLAAQQSITAYDASYLVLARQLSVPFVTADQRLAHAMAGTDYDIRWLGNFSVLA